MPVLINHSTFLFLSAILFICLITLIIKLSSSPSLQYKQHQALFSPAENTFFKILLSAIQAPAFNEKYLLFGKVRIADVLTPRNNLNRQQWQIAFNKISSKHFDFVLCDKQTLKVIAVIELDDKSHQRKKVQARDKLVNKACASADLPLIRFTAKKGYNINEVTNILHSTLSS
ncbi:DUF2726 domain-containing protein [uncultured Shewanella sp.]|uniref:DUF2726 domain-containing protein n=1 Tax=uncultured Shewanella sp. TaxID=173975 RepID=UPI00262F6238|nr:DUF2726 domain-containing protein [uncultured Shewanella sp.]